MNKPVFEPFLHAFDAFSPPIRGAAGEVAECLQGPVTPASMSCMAAMCAAMQLLMEAELRPHEVAPHSALAQLRGEQSAELCA